MSTLWVFIDFFFQSDECHSLWSLSYLYRPRVSFDLTMPRFLRCDIVDSVHSNIFIFMLHGFLLRTRFYVWPLDRRMLYHCVHLRLCSKVKSMDDIVILQAAVFFLKSTYILLS